MIVTCDHCGARYKLDDSKISGRGAKITCPRCRHVFVVYKDPSAGEATPAPPPSAASASVAPPDPAPAAPDLDVHSLDFRKVGIQSWKVKVKIGLVYDFSDYKTLAKYISDGRVTPSDLLSHNGTEWTPIGELVDVKQHFVDVYVEAERAQAEEATADASGAVADFEDDDQPTNIIGMADLAGTLGAERATSATGAAGPARIADGAGAVEELFKTGGASEDASPRFVDPFEQRKKSRERKAKGGGRKASSAKPRPAAPAPPPPTEEKKGGGATLLVAAVALLLLGGGAWYFSQGGDSGTTTTAVQPRPQPVPPKAKATEPQGDDAGGIVPEDAGDEVETDDWGIEEEPQLIPVVPAEFRNGATPSAGGGAPPSTPNSTAPSQQPATPGVAYASMSAADHAQAGWDAYRRGDYSSAVAAFRQAVSMSPSQAEYSGKLGASLLRAGDLGGARAPLQQAATAGYAPAHEFLGDLDAELGDSPGAIQHYQDYLATGPGDAARVQQKINRLNGT